MRKPSIILAISAASVLVATVGLASAQATAFDASVADQIQVSRTSAAQLFAARRTVRPEIAEALGEDARLRICAGWGAAEVPRSAAAPVVSGVPALILAGEYDPLTPPAYAEIASRTLRNSRWFEFPGIGHAVQWTSPCAYAVMIDFLAAPQLAPDASCMKDMRPPAWIIPGP